MIVTTAFRSGYASYLLVMALPSRIDAGRGGLLLAE
jgi:hypothetical protein